MPLLAATLMIASGCNSLTEKEGCSDPNALNFDPDAEVDDGSCAYPAGGIEIDENITSDFTFENHREDPGAVEYIITRDIDIGADVVIEPGVVIEMNAGVDLYIADNGSLKAIGTANDPIVFRGTTPTPGFWEKIEFNSNNPNNILEFVEIAHGGSSSTYDHSSVWLQNNVNTQLALKNCIIRDSEGFGLTAESSTRFSDFANNTFKNNGDAGLRITTNNIAEIDEQSVYNDGNAEAYIYVDANSLTNDATWPVTNAPLYFDNDVDINADLTIQPGTKLLLGSEVELYVSNQGLMNAIGAASEPIIIKGAIETPGYWEKIEINSNNPLNEFEHVEIAHGGSSSTYNYASIWIQNSVTSRFAMHNCTISDSYGWGMFVESGTDVTPSDKASMEAANTFVNNGTGNCSVNNF